MYLFLRAIEPQKLNSSASPRTPARGPKVEVVPLPLPLPLAISRGSARKEQEGQRRGEEEDKGQKRGDVQHDRYNEKPGRA